MGGKDFEFKQGRFLQEEFNYYRYTSDAVFKTSSEVYRRRFGGITGWYWDIAYAKAMEDSLCEEFGVEDEVVGICVVRYFFDDFSVVSSKAGVEIAEILSEANVLQGGEKTVTDILIDGHTSFEGFAACSDARAHHDVTNSESDKTYGKRYHLRVVLIIGVNHHNDIGVGFQDGIVTSFLVGAVTPIFLVDEDVESEISSNFDSSVGAAIITDYYLVGSTEWDITYGFFQSEFGVVGRHYNDNFLSM